MSMTLWAHTPMTNSESPIHSVCVHFKAALASAAGFAAAALMALLVAAIAPELKLIMFDHFIFPGNACNSWRTVCTRGRG